MHRLEKLIVDVPGLRPGSLGAYGLAAGMAAVATAIRVALDPFVVGIQFITFFPAVIVTTFISGLRAGIACMFLCAVGAWFFVLPPQRSFALDMDQVSALVLFMLVAATDVVLVGAIRFAVARYKELSASLERKVAERTKELLNTQAAFAQSQKMEAVGHLTGGIAHDFNNMLAVVTGNLDLLRRRLLSGRSDVMQYVDNAIEGANRAATLTQRLLAFARHQPLAPAVTDINKLVQGISELLRRSLGERVELECVLGGGLWQAHIDPSQLENAVTNLAVNARDAMPEGGKLTIETANAHLDEQYARSRPEVTAGQYVVVAVSDTGTGMSTEVATQAIEPFFTTKEPGKGTGLGLSQVYGFVKQSGGHMAIYSEVGRGTTVRLYLPRATAGQATQPAHAREADTPVPIGSQEVSILAVEDDDHVRRMTSAALRELGYRVFEASNGEEALEILDRNPTITLLFTDVVMPGLDGRRLVEAAQRQRPDLKAFYTTGYTRNAIVHNGVLDPHVSLLMKPFTVDQLARKVREVLDDATE